MNENECYEIKLPEQIRLEELPMINARFNSLLKNFSKFNLVLEPTPIENQEIKEQKVYNREQYRILKENRNLFIELLNSYYNKTPNEFEDFKNKNNFTFKRTEMSGIHIIRLREFHQVKPIEIGLIKFPTRNEQIKDLRIQK